jgi:hypothetical protein
MILEFHCSIEINNKWKPEYYCLLYMYNNTVTNLLKALRNSGHVVPQQDDATIQWKRFLHVGACTCDVILYGACAGDVSSVFCWVAASGPMRCLDDDVVRDATVEQMSQAVFSTSPLGALGDYTSRQTT